MCGHMKVAEEGASLGSTAETAEVPSDSVRPSESETVPGTIPVVHAPPACPTPPPQIQIQMGASVKATFSNGIGASKAHLLTEEPGKKFKVALAAARPSALLSSPMRGKMDVKMTVEASSMSHSKGALILMETSNILPQ